MNSKTLNIATEFFSSIPAELDIMTIRLEKNHRNQMCYAQVPQIKRSVDTTLLKDLKHTKSDFLLALTRKSDGSCDVEKSLRNLTYYLYRSFQQALQIQRLRNTYINEKDFSDGLDEAVAILENINGLDKKIVHHLFKSFVKKYGAKSEA
jgi:hypothetical protein